MSPGTVPSSWELSDAVVVCDSIAGGVSPGGLLVVSVMVVAAFWFFPGSNPKRLPLSQSDSLAALPGCPPSIEPGPKGKRWLYVFYR